MRIDRTPCLKPPIFHRHAESGMGHPELGCEVTAAEKRDSARDCSLRRGRAPGCPTGGHKPQSARRLDLRISALRLNLLSGLFIAAVARTRLGTMANSAAEAPEPASTLTVDRQLSRRGTNAGPAISVDRIFGGATRSSARRSPRTLRLRPQITVRRPDGAQEDGPADRSESASPVSPGPCMEPVSLDPILGSARRSTHRCHDAAARSHHAPVAS
jgi:hypothetical protein